MRGRFILWLLCGFFSFCAGCQKAEITTYSVPKEESVASASLIPSWTVPEGWEERQPVPPRKASYFVSSSDGLQAELSVTVFPGAVGGLLPNINRWRDQLGLEPVSEDAVAGLTEAITVNDKEVTIVDLENDVQRMMIAIVRAGDYSWFFKFAGDQSLVNEQDMTFAQFIQSIQF